LCQNFIPKDTDEDFSNSANIKNKVIHLLRSMNVSDYMKLNRSRSEINNFRKEIVKTKVRNGIVKGFKIHKLNHKVLIDKKLQGVLENLYNTYGNYIVDTYNNLSANFSPSFSKQILTRFYVYDNKNEERIGIDVNLKDCVYLIEFEIGREDSTVVGDKFTNRLNTASL